MLVPDANAEPRRRPEVAMARRARLRHEHALADLVQREERDRVAVRLVEQDDVLAGGHPLPAGPHAHPPAARPREQPPPRQRLSHEEPRHRSGPQRSLLPCQAHRVLLWLAAVLTWCRYSRRAGEIPFASRNSRIAVAISTTWVSVAKWPVSRNWTRASRMSLRNASAPAGMKKGSCLPQIASNGGCLSRK